jgi:hypothetical protein
VARRHERPEILRWFAIVGVYRDHRSSFAMYLGHGMGNMLTLPIKNGLHSSVFMWISPGNLIPLSNCSVARG